MKSNNLFFYQNQKFRPQRGPLVYISDFFEGVKVKFFRFISKQIAYLVSLNTLVLESIKISWKLIIYFSMKIKNSDPLYTFQIFSGVSKLNFFALSKQIAYLLSLNTFVIESIKTSWKLIVYFSMKIKNSDFKGGDSLYTL